jgi:hypothetical protein
MMVSETDKRASPGWRLWHRQQEMSRQSERKILLLLLLVNNFLCLPAGDGTGMVTGMKPR